MFSSKMLALFVVAFVFGASDAQYLASPYYYPSAYASAYAYPSVYTGYAAYAGYAAYPAFYGWGSNKGGAAPGAQGPAPGQKLTNNQ